jgi:hypothetical protein
MTKNLFACFVLVSVFMVVSSTALAQKETATGVETEKDITLLRRDLRGEKKQLIAMNIPLTEAEATKFWPLYDQYIAELTTHYDKFYGSVKDFAAIQKTATDAQTNDLMKTWADQLVQIAQTRQKYIPIFQKVIPAQKVAKFMMVDRRLYALIDLQVVAETPLLADIK